MRATPLVLALALAACSSSPSNTARVSDSESRQLLIDRNWIDHMPQSEKDRLHVYRFVPTMGGGVYQDRTLFKGTFELFMYKVDGDQIEMFLPETHEKVRSKFHIEKADGPAPFDLKLVVENDPRGPSVYYGIRAETDRDGHLLEQRLHPAAK